MRTQFLGHFKETDEAVEKLWQTAIFVFDANVLLNLYRYSDDTRNEFIELLRTLKNRSWLPEQAAHEFLNNRASVINNQVSAYGTTLSDIQKLGKSFAGLRGHPFISKSTKTKFDSAIKTINAEMAENKSKQEELIHRDGIKNQVADLYDGRVGERYTSEELAEIFTQGAERYDAKIPPGYKDGRKIPDPKTESDKRSNFGDWIIWKQIMGHATSAKKPIIFVTDDGKEDWWEKVSGKTLGPRPELTKEFVETTSQKILIYTPDSFLSLSKKQLKTTISTESIDEVEAEHSKREEQRHKNRLDRHIKEGYKLEGLDRDGERAFLLKRRDNKLRNLYSRDTQQDGIKQMERKRLMASSDISSPELRAKLRAELSSKLDIAMSHQDMLRRRVEVLRMDYHHLSDVKDEEMIHEQLLQQHSMQEELNANSNNISNLKAQLAYFSERDDLL